MFAKLGCAVFWQSLLSILSSLFIVDRWIFGIMISSSSYSLVRTMIDSHIQLFRIAGEVGISFGNHQLRSGIDMAWLMFRQIFLKFKFRRVPKLQVSRSVYVFILIFLCGKFAAYQDSLEFEKLNSENISNEFSNFIPHDVHLFGSGLASFKSPRASFYLFLPRWCSSSAADAWCCGLTFTSPAKM